MHPNAPNDMEARAVSGWIAILFVCALLAFGLSFAVAGLQQRSALAIGSGIGLLAAGLFCTRGFFTLQPNEAAVMMLLGSYAGTCQDSGFHWVSPLHQRTRISLRARTLTTRVLKVPDQRGNPIEIAAVVVWRVRDAARALFESEDYAAFLDLMCEAALRELAGRHAYDRLDEPVLGARVQTLREDAPRLADALRAAIRSRVESAGIDVVDARLAHLAYAPELAREMLRRQQADAVLAARRRLVEGAVDLVESALIDLNEKSLAAFNEAQRVALVSSLMTILVGDEGSQRAMPLARAEG
jgi:regulator of protease activity HflC (stomatin/prohibitin superfamily)